MCQHAHHLYLAIKIIEAQYAEINSRYDLLNQKLSSYIAALAIIGSVVVLFLQSLISKDSQAVGYFYLLGNAPVIRSVAFMTMLVSLCWTITSIVLALVRVFQGLTPLTLQVVDKEAFDLAMQNRSVKAMTTYAKDLATATDWNKEAIRNRFSLLFAINRWLINVVVSVLVLLLSDAVFVLWN